MKTLEKRQRKSFSKWIRETGPGREREKKYGRRLAQLTTLVGSSVWKERARWSWRLGLGQKGGGYSTMCWRGLEGEQNEEPTFAAYGGGKIHEACVCGEKTRGGGGAQRCG